MKTTLPLLMFPLALLGLAHVKAASPSLPTLLVEGAKPAELVLTWPTSYEDFQLEESATLKGLGRWSPVSPISMRKDDRFHVSLPLQSRTRFYRLRYSPNVLASTNPTAIFGLRLADSGPVVVGQPFTIEVQATCNAVLSAASFRITGSGSALITDRKSVPRLFAIPSVLDPSSGEGEFPGPLIGMGLQEVVLGTEAKPLDGALPGQDQSVARLELTPSAAGVVTITLQEPAALTTAVSPAGDPFSLVQTNPWSSTITVNVAPASPGSGPPNYRRTGIVLPANLSSLVFVRNLLGRDPSMLWAAPADINHDGRIDLRDVIAARDELASVAAASAPLEIRLNEIAVRPAPGEAPWVELKHNSTSQTNLTSVELRHGNGAVLMASGQAVPLWPGALVVVAFDGEKPTELIGDPSRPTGVRLHVPPPATGFNATNDECSLWIEGELVDSVAWGNSPQRKQYLNVDLGPLPEGGSIGRDGCEPETWRRFAVSTPLVDNGLPAPTPHYPYSGGIVRNGVAAQFSWQDVRETFPEYEIEVADTDQFLAPLVRAKVHTLRYQLQSGLPLGSYFWRVRTRLGELPGPWSKAVPFEVLSVPSPTPKAPVGLQSALFPNINAIAWFSSHPVQRPRKDSDMLCMECETDRGPHAWNRDHEVPYPTGEPVPLCNHDASYIPVAIAATVCEYYGTTIDQDEISYSIYGNLPDGPEIDLGLARHGPENDFGHGAAISVFDALQAALKPLTVVREEKVVPQPANILWEDLMTLIDSQIPLVGLVQLADMTLVGPLVITGYLEAHPTPTTVKRFLYYQDPFTTDGTLEWSKIWEYSLAHPTVPPGATKLDHDDDTFHDSDGDGLIDFDEERRFGTSTTDPDTDTDGINDYTEVWSYKFGLGGSKRVPDPDGDGYRAEIDFDTDGDGCEDGEEDQNHDGSIMTVYPGVTYWSANETDPFLVETFNFEMHADRDQVLLKESTGIQVRLFARFGSRQFWHSFSHGVKLELLTGELGYLGDTPGTTLLENLQSRDGSLQTRFTASTNEGTARIRATYKPCEKHRGATNEITINITGAPYIFVVQTEARLTGPRVASGYQIKGTSSGYSSSVTGSEFFSKDPKAQTASGRFYSPHLRDPGLYINTIVAPGYDGVELFVDNVQCQGRQWKRSRPSDNPVSWKVVVQETRLALPPVVQVYARDGRTYTTPLVWWAGCNEAAVRLREIASGPGGNGQWFSFDTWDHTYRFFFGDGDSNGQDQSETWPDQVHTTVSFIPTRGMPGVPVGKFLPGKAPVLNDAWIDQTGGTDEHINNFGTYKNLVHFYPRASWSVKSFILFSPRYDPEAELNLLGSMGPQPFLNNFLFARDYLPAELKTLELRHTAPYQYNIEMLTE